MQPNKKVLKPKQKKNLIKKRKGEIHKTYANFAVADQDKCPTKVRTLDAKVSKIKNIYFVTFFNKSGVMAKGQNLEITNQKCEDAKLTQNRVIKLL